MALQVFTEVFAREHQLMKVDPRRSTYLACCLLMRGKMSIADMNRNVMRLKPNLRMVHWNPDGFKLGICSKPPVGTCMLLAEHVPFAAGCHAACISSHACPNAAMHAIQGFISTNRTLKQIAVMAMLITKIITSSSV